MSLTGNKRLVTELFDAINERRLGDLPRYLAADVVDHNRIIHGEPDEPGAAFAAIGMQLTALNPYRARIDGLIAEGDQVVARITQSGTHTGAHPRMPVPTGRDFENESIFVFTVRDNKITEIRGVADRLTLFLQLAWTWPAAG